MKDAEHTAPRRKRRPLSLEHWHIIAFYLMVYDFLAANGAYLAALWLRFDCRFSMIPEYYLMSWLTFVPFYTVFCLATFWALRLYRSLWRFASFTELRRVTASSAVTATFHTLAITLFLQQMPTSYSLIGAGIQFLLVLAVRHGGLWGIGAGLAFGTLKFFGAGGMAVNWQSMLLDYSLAYMAVGVAGFFGKKLGVKGLAVTALIGCLARFGIHYLSGVTIYAQYMPSEFFGMSMTTPVFYSLLYNGSYMLPNTVIALLVMSLLGKPLEKILFPKEA